MIFAETRGGALELDAGAASDRCDACGAMGDADVLSVAVLNTGQPRQVMAVCGDCLAEGLAIVFGRRHVQQGGDADELRGAAEMRIPPREVVDLGEQPGLAPSGDCVCARSGAHPADPGLRCVHAAVCAERLGGGSPPAAAAAAVTERTVSHAAPGPREHRLGGPVDGLRYCAACGYAEAAVSERSCSGVSGQLGALLTVEQLRARRHRERRDREKRIVSATITMHQPAQPGIADPPAYLAAQQHALKMMRGT